MRRALFALAAPVAALVVGAGAGAVSPNAGAEAASHGAADAATGECIWQRRSRRVVRQVQRHGRHRHQVRTRHWWACVPLPPAPVATPAPAPGPAPSPNPGPTPEPPTTPEVGHLSVKADEYSFTLSRPSVAVGEMIVELNNQGEDPHNLNLQREGDEGAPLEVSEAGPQEHRTARFSLPPGSYRLWCSLPEHDEKGMNATLTVSSG